MNKPKGIRAAYWKLWNWGFNRRLKKALKEIEVGGRLDPKQVEKITITMLTDEANKLYEAGATYSPMVYWNGGWFVCERVEQK